EALRDTSTRILHHEDLIGTLFEIVRGGATLFKASLGVIYLLGRSTETGNLIKIEEPVLYPKMSKQPIEPRLDRPEGITYQIVTSREIKIFAPITPHDHVNPKVLEAGIRRMIGVPIID